MCEDGYQGYPNRETWAAHLWLSNEETLYHQVQGVVAGHAEEWEAAEALKGWFEELWWELVRTHDGRNMILDIGSLWRIEWDDVARGFTE